MKPLNKVDEGIRVSPLNFNEEVRSTMKLVDPVIIHDTTLREGEQTPGVVFNIEDKLKIARKLDEVGVQQIEAGFPAAFEGEKKAVKAIVDEGLNAKVFGFSRAVFKDVDAVIDCDTYGIVLSFPPSDIHIKHKLGITRDQYLDKAIEVVEYAKQHGLYISYSAEDSTRADLNFLKKVLKSVVKAGVDRVRIVDTLGAIIPTAMKYLITEVKKIVNTPIEIHCHNDHGLAVANSLAAVEAGASVVSSSVIGLGERAGIASTEEIIIALHNLYNVGHFKTKKLCELCKLVEKISKTSISASKPVVGRNVFVHTSGIHQAGVLKDTTTYEPYPPELVGQKRTLILGKLCGSHAVAAKLAELNIKLHEEEVTQVLQRVKAISERRRSALSDEEVLEIVKEISMESDE